MKVVLLTHEREIDKTTNTGCLVNEVLREMCELTIWRRKEPDVRLLHLFDQGQAVLLFPVSELPVPGADDSYPSTSIASEDPGVFMRYSHFVLLDATWQQAKKMYRQSVYLQHADKLALDQAPSSTFARRRNQREGGLCTAECVIELLKVAGNRELSAKLTSAYERFNLAI